MALTSVAGTALTSALANRPAARQIKAILNMLANGPASVTFTVAAESANNIDVTIQVKDENGVNLASVCSLEANVVSSAAATAFNANAYTITATTGAVVELVAAKVLRILTNASGVAVIRFNTVSAVTCFLAVVLPNDSMTVSATITHV